MEYFIPSILDKSSFVTIWSEYITQQRVIQEYFQVWATLGSRQTPVLPCSNVIEWMTRRIDHGSRTVLNFEDKCVSNYQAPVLNQLYCFKESQVKVTQEIESIDFLSIMKGWWSEG